MARLENLSINREEANRARRKGEKGKERRRGLADRYPIGGREGREAITVAKERDIQEAR